MRRPKADPVQAATGKSLPRRPVRKGSTALPPAFAPSLGWRSGGATMPGDKETERLSATVAPEDAWGRHV
jgi:hypothetical protein